MKINVNHPSFISLMDKISVNMLSIMNVENYFSKPPEVKASMSYTVFNLLKSMPAVKVISTDIEFKTFVDVLCKRSEENENFEFASILSYIYKNFDVINELTVKKKSSTVKKEKKIENKE